MKIIMSPREYLKSVDQNEKPFYKDQYFYIDCNTLNEVTGWNINIKDDMIEFDTYMQNFSMYLFLQDIGVDITKIFNIEDANCNSTTVPMEYLIGHYYYGRPENNV